MLFLDPKDIDTIIAISREFSLTAVGQRLGISRSAVSQRLDKIEERLGYTIATRKGRLTLTTEGKEITEHCILMKRGFANLQNKLEHLKGPRLDIMADEVLLKRDLPLVIQQMLIDTPRIKINLQRGSFSEIIHNVIDGTIDAGLIAGDPHVTGLRLIPYRIERVCLMMASSHPLSNKSEMAFSTAIKWPMIHSDSLEHITPIIEDMAFKMNVNLLRPITCPSIDVQACYAAQTDIGIALTIESAANVYKASESIHIAHLSDEWAKNQLYICTKEIGSNSQTTTEFIKQMVSCHTLIKRSSGT